MSCSCNLDVSSYPIKHPPSHKSLPTSTICLLEGFSAPHLAQLRLCWCGPALLPSHPATLCLPQPFQPSSVQKIVTEYQLWTKNIFLFPSNFPATHSPSSLLIQILLPEIPPPPSASLSAWKSPMYSSTPCSKDTSVKPSQGTKTPRKERGLAWSRNSTKPSMHGAE